MSLSFFVQGNPKTTQTGSVITVRGRSFPIRRGTAWAQLVGLVAREYAPAQLLTGPLEVTWTFVMPRPKKPKARVPITRPDTGNLAKGLSDSLNGVLWHDDCQIVREIVEKVYAEDGGAPGVRVNVMPFVPAGLPRL